MTEKIKYNKDEKWVPYEQLAETPQQTITRLEQENKELKKQIESQKGLITEGGKQQYQYLQKIDELQQENKELKEDLKSQQMINLKRQEIALDYWNALEEIKVISDNYNLTVNERRKQIADKINEVLQCE